MGSVVNNVIENLNKRGKGLAQKAPIPMTSGYFPEIDILPELGHEDAAYYHYLIAVLRWIVDMGRVDVNVEASMFSLKLVMPRQGHLEELLHIFAYLRKHMNTEMVFDPSVLDIYKNFFQLQDYSYLIYSSPVETLEEPFPPILQNPLGNSFTIRTFVDSYHAGKTLTRRSRTGFIIFLNIAPIYWYTKKQS